MLGEKGDCFWMKNKLETVGAGDDRACGFCDSTNLLKTEEGELLCKNCGGVVEEDVVEHSAKPRAFTSEEKKKKARTGSTLTYTKHHRGIVTRIGNDMSGMSSNKRGRYTRMKKWDRRLSGSKPRNMRFALTQMQRLIDDLKLPKSAHEESARLYEKAWEKEVVKGRRVENIVAGMVFLVCRMQNIPRTLSEVSEAAEIDKNEVGKNYRYIARELDKRVVPAKPKDFIPRYGSSLGLSGETRADAGKIISQAREEGLIAGKSTEGVVASALYIATVLGGERKSQKEIAETVGVTEVTIRKGYREFAENLGLMERVDEVRDI